MRRFRGVKLISGTSKICSHQILRFFVNFVILCQAFRLVNIFDAEFLSPLTGLPTIRSSSAAPAEKRSPNTASTTADTL
jgi:hypothetical protein